MFLFNSSTMLLRPLSSSSSLASLAPLASLAASPKSSQGSSKCCPSSMRPFTTLNTHTPYNLIFVRHGQSTWNRDNRFIGWTDTPLTPDGVLEARLAGQLLANSHILFDEAHTSLLRRSIRTVNLILMEMGQEYIPVYKDWKLNERSYGDLVGLNKKEVVKKFGKEQVKRWRRSYGEKPPSMRDDHEFHPKRDPRYHHMIEEIPSSESLECTLKRSSKYWDEVLAPSLRKGKTVLVVGHENNLRSLLMRLEGIGEEEIIDLNLPRAVPLAYRLDGDLRVIVPEEKIVGGRKVNGVNGVNGAHGINGEHVTNGLNGINGLNGLNGSTSTTSNSKLDKACQMLTGTWLGGDEAVSEILERDDKQVYDTSIEYNLERGSEGEKWRKWTQFKIGGKDESTLTNEMKERVEKKVHLNNLAPKLKEEKKMESVFEG